MKDILIIGRGLSGATLSFKLLEQGIKHRIIDVPTISSSSKVAAGLVNPIVLKRLKMVQGAEEFMESIPYHYKHLETITKSQFYNETTIQHVFANVGEMNLWEEKKDISFHSQYLMGFLKNSNSYINAPHGFGLMQGIGWLDTQSYLQAHSSYCKEQGITIEERLIESTEIAQLSSSGSTVILCNGHLLKDWDLLPKGTFSPTRGEVMTIETEHLPKDHILHSSIFTIHLGNNKFKVGATYHWDNLNDQTTDDGLKRLKEDLEKVYTGSYTILEHQAGVRPNTKDRRPLIGRLNNGLLIFNGMGSRAALMTPYLSTLFMEFLINNHPIPTQYDIQRFL